MEKCQLTVDCKPYLHSRPLAVIGNIAEAFRSCEVFIVHQDCRFSTNQMIDLSLRGIQDQDKIELQTKGKDEAVAMSVMKEVFRSLSELPLSTRPSALGRDDALSSYQSSYKDCARDLYRRIAEILAGAAVTNRYDILGAIRESLRISDEYKVTAKLNYAKGMHVLPSQLLGGLRVHFPESRVEILYVDHKGKPDSVDGFDTLRLCTTMIADGQEVTIKASGKAPEKVAHTIKNIIENMRTITQTLEKRQQDCGSHGVGEREILRGYFA